MSTNRQLITTFENDVGFDIEFTLKDDTGAVVDLADVAEEDGILLIVQRQGKSTLHFSKEMTVVDADQGTCKFTVGEGDFAESGTYFAEIQVTFDGGKIVTFNNFLILVKPELPKIS